jgi:signal peptidase I
VRRAGLILLFGGGAVIALLVVTFVLVGGLYRAPTASMVPTIRVGDRFAVLKIGTPKLGDIVVHYAPAGAEAGADSCAARPRAGEMCARAIGRHTDVKFVKRIVAVGGDRISMRDGKVIRNGKPETTDGPRACSGQACNFPRTITVPEGTYYMLGDNRGASDDSRFWGPVRADWVIGRYCFGF